MTFDSRDSIIGQSLYLRRHWEYPLIRRTAELMRAHGLLDSRRATLVDAGANIGSTTVAFLRDRIFKRAVAVEPDVANFGLLESNVRQNGLGGRVRCVQVALGAAPGTAALELSPDNFGDHRVRVTAVDGEYRESNRITRPIAIERLDDLLRANPEFGPQTIGLLWIDVQGFEGHVLQGATSLLELGPTVELEFWPYGLARAGMDKETFLNVMNASFTHFVNLRDPQERRQPIADVEQLYRMYEGPYGDTELLLFRA